MKTEAAKGGPLNAQSAATAEKTAEKPDRKTAENAGRPARRTEKAQHDTAPPGGAGGENA